MSADPAAPRTLYRYGPIAWLWRVLIVGGQAGGWFLVFIGFTSVEFWAYAVAAPLILPGLFFGHVVATQVDILDDGTLTVTTLMGLRRRLMREDLGKPRYYAWAQTEVTQVYAPRAWIPVRGRWPIYLDLMAEIPDRSAFANIFRIKKGDVPRAR
jgi:hypothetical protein